MCKMQMLNILYLLTRQVVTWQIVSETITQIELQKIGNIFSSKTVARKDSTNDRGLPFILSG
jgi:hypothetical protein